MANANTSGRSAVHAVFAWLLIFIIAIGVLVIAYYKSVPRGRASLPFGWSEQQDFFYALSLLTFIALAVVLWYFLRRGDREDIERPRMLATFAVVLVGLMILWGIFFRSMAYIDRPQEPLVLTAEEQAGLNAEEQAQRIQEIRLAAAQERADRIVNAATLAGLIIAPLGTLVGFVAGQAAGAAGQDRVVGQAGAAVAEAVQRVTEAHQRAEDIAGEMDPRQYRQARAAGRIGPTPS